MRASRRLSGRFRMFMIDRLRNLLSAKRRFGWRLLGLLSRYVKRGIRRRMVVTMWLRTIRVVMRFALVNLNIRLSTFVLVGLRILLRVWRATGLWRLLSLWVVTGR